MQGLLRGRLGGRSVRSPHDPYTPHIPPRRRPVGRLRLREFGPRRRGEARQAEGPRRWPTRTASSASWRRSTRPSGASQAAACASSGSTSTGGAADGNAEINLIRDVNAGKADLGWAGTRVFDELGDPAFNPLHAPLLIDSYDLEEKVLSDDVVDTDAREPRRARASGYRRAARPAAQAARQASAARSRRLGRHPHQLQRRRPDRAGAALARSEGSLRQSERAARTAETLDGIETHIAAVPGNHYHHDMPYLTGNVVLWPRPLVLFAGPDVSSDDLAVLRQAAKAAIPEAIALSRSLESDGLSEACRASSRSSPRPRRRVDGLRAAVPPGV